MIMKIRKKLYLKIGIVAVYIFIKISLSYNLTQLFNLFKYPYYTQIKYC